MRSAMPGAARRSPTGPARLAPGNEAVDRDGVSSGGALEQMPAARASVLESVDAVAEVAAQMAHRVVPVFEFAVWQPVDPSRAPDAPGGNHLGPGSVLVDSAGQVARQVDFPRRCGVGERANDTLSSTVSTGNPY